MAATDSTGVLVIGAGLMGSAAAWSLAERGNEVTVVERDVPANAQGSSHGSARIFRYAYPDPLYTKLVVEAHQRFTALERRTNTQLITPAGALDFGVVRKPQALAQVLEATGVSHELLTPEAAAERWPGIRFDTEVLWQEAGGVIDAEGTVHAQLQLAQASGARVLNNWEAVSVRRDGTGWLVESATGQRMHAAKVVLAAGGWLAKLLAAADLPSRFINRLPKPQVTQENAFHFPYKDPDATGEPKPGERASWPTFIHKSDEICVYSLPGGRDAGFRGQKIAEFLGGNEITDASTQTGQINPANRERIIDYVRTRLPGLVPEPYAETTCLFTMLPEEDFFLDADDGLIIASPCSGHGAKFAPLIGDLVADLADGAAPVSRFAVDSPVWTGGAR